jgi:hypothetical protein
MNRTTHINVLLSRSANENNWRFESMFHLGAIAATADSFPPLFDQAFDEDAVDIAKAVGIPGKDALDVESEGFIDYLRDHDLTGLLVQVATPIREYSGDGDSYGFHWGHYRTEWLYGDDFSELLPKIEAWVEEQVDDFRKKSGRKAA